MKKKIILSIIVLIALGTITGIYLWNKPKRTAAGEKAVASLPADDLFQVFSNDENTANAAYLNKVVEVNGTVVKTETDPAGADVVYLETSDLLGTISCTFIPGTKADTKTGDTVKIKGICTGFLTDVILTQCIKQ